ncbi:hypothetical protein Q5762_14520 [Streptomyces sp. P9(2023)]|uniref:hypothetical protein n=1 Tax=Streptomyces sp. P9(2023) TaxID=3064394 RepID=UPI0028F41836|nr:hypothetical protein [Streptomyces sp. P9(2023)]MDT9689531.1 hypothetical protein [Streptomyces sp. P9(2023)]
MDHNDTSQHHVRITAHGDTATVEIDGDPVDPRAVGAYTISQIVGEPAHVLMHVTDRGSTRWSGMARVSVADVPDPGPAAAAFLDAIDAQALERAALARTDLGTGPHSLTQAMLTQLGEWARGV